MSIAPGRPTELRFPDNFLWGTAASAHQVEGGTQNDWTDWEPGRVKDGSTSVVACDQYRRYRSDFAQLAELGQRAHRFSIEWSRVEPAAGRFDRQALAHYREVAQTLRAVGIEPVATLHHFTNPRWLAARGGWLSPAAPALFARYTRQVAQALGDLVSCWLTINEPTVYAIGSYGAGAWPPGRRDWRLVARVILTMLRAHGLAYRTLHAQGAGARLQVSLAHNLRWFEPARPGWFADRWLAALAHRWLNLALLRALVDGRFRFPFAGTGWVPEAAGTMDFFGLNYYTRNRLAFAPGARRPLLVERRPAPRAALTQSGWEIYPDGLYRLLKTVAGFGKPVLVTENGMAEPADARRPHFLVAHLAAVHRALREGVPVTGYLYWSAWDNFEWLEGLRVRFGLIHVDFATQARTVKPSGRLYAKICREGALTAEMLEGIPA